MPVLRISDLPLGEARRVEVTWQDGPSRRAAVATFAYQADKREAEQIRWYLEDYLEFPTDPAPALAADAEQRLREIGADLFRRVFTGQDAAVIWGQVQAQLPEVRVEVDTDPAEAPGVPWELLRDPGTGTALALAAKEFVRTHLQTAGQVRLPETAGDQLRVLLVICRPDRDEDVPFRSVASRLVRGGAAGMKGLNLDVLRPATYPRLAEVLREAADAGRPYHVVHFDGHGTYLDLADVQPEDNHEGDQTTATTSPGGKGGRGVGLSPLRYGISVAGEVRAGQHGYLIFEDSASSTNQQLADGPTLGRLLTATGVPVLVLNACRSAYSEAPSHPGDPEALAEDAGSGSVAEAVGEGAAGVADVHARIRAYGSLAAEVADTGVPGVVAMRYNVYVVTAAQYVADLYAHLLAGKTLGQATTVARWTLADNPDRHIGAESIALQDWTVPVVYEAAPLTLLRPEQRLAPLIQLTPADTPVHEAMVSGDGASDEVGVPRAPDAGFFGRDETLLALDRAFDTNTVVLLHAFAGAGKTSTAAEFARWYHATGGLRDSRLGTGLVLWSSLEHHLVPDRLLDTVGDAFEPLLEANGIHWQAIIDHGRRRHLVLQLLAQVPVLWVWDNIEPVTGFPPGTPSAWTQEEQDQIAAFLRDVAQQTRCKVLLTSRRDERYLLGDLPTRILLPPMPMRERLLFAAELVARHGHSDSRTDWRPLLRYTAGNPLTITVLVGQALREGLTTTSHIEEFMARIRTGEASLEAGEDAALGRTRSLAASLSYGFTHAFTHAECAQLAVLHLFRDTANALMLLGMGNQESLGEDAVPELAELDRDAATALLDRAAGIGLLEPIGTMYYRIHPALPWYFTALFTASYGQPGNPSAARAIRAYTKAIADLGTYWHNQAASGGGAQAIPVLRAEEANLRHALDLARTDGLWDAAANCVSGLRILYTQTGRDGEWARLVTAITPDFIDPATGGPLPGRDGQWDTITSYRVMIAEQVRDWQTATALQNTLIAWNRDKAAEALAAPAPSLTERQRNQIRRLAVRVEDLGSILFAQGDAGCVLYFQEAFDLHERIGGHYHQANLAMSLGTVYLRVPELRDLDQAEHWYQRSLRLRASSDEQGQVATLAQLGALAVARIEDAQAAGSAEPVLLKYLNAGLSSYQTALDRTPADNHEWRGVIENELGTIYAGAGYIGEALRHFQQAIRHKEARGDIFEAGQTRFNIALLLGDADRASDALLYARAALHDFERTGADTSKDAEGARILITQLERRIG